MRFERKRELQQKHVYMGAGAAGRVVAGAVGVPAPEPVEAWIVRDDIQPVEREMKYPKGTKMLVVADNGHNFRIGSVVEVYGNDICKGYCEDRGYIDTQYVSFGDEVIAFEMENE